MHNSSPMLLKKKKFTFAQIAALVYLTLIGVGTVLLMLPISSAQGTPTSLLDCLFTATSATCVTGLIVVDTATHWSFFGQVVIILLIQTGGMGFMAMVAMLFWATGKKLGLTQRRLLWQSAGGEDANAKHLTRNILACTFICEGIGTVLLSFFFVPKYGLGKGLFYSIFHAISAFCNAGFDILPEQVPFSSFLLYPDHVYLNVVLMLLIIFGGLGFFALYDLWKNRCRWMKLSLHTKLVLVVSALLIVLGSLGLLAFEHNAAFSDFDFGTKVLASMFQSVSARTAGIATADLSTLSPAGCLWMCILMVIGGSPASTAGGMKTTTFAILILGILAEARRKPSVTVFKRRLDAASVTRAWTICAIYFMLVIICTMLLCAIEPITLMQGLFEISSAIGTVGLTMGITPSLCILSKVLICVLMFAGKLGAMTLAFALAERVESVPLQRPVGTVIIG